MVNKSLIIGSSLTGKTTLVKYLRDNLNMEVQEIDEELNRLNGGKFPTDMEYKNNVLVPKIKQEVLDKNKIIFFTNVHYFTPEDIVSARQRGFKIILLFVDREELEIRNKHRMENEGYEDQSHWLDGQLHYQKEIEDKKLIDIAIETNKPVEDIVQELVTFLQQT